VGLVLARKGRHDGAGDQGLSVACTGWAHWAIIAAMLATVRPGHFLAIRTENITAHTGGLVSELQLIYMDGEGLQHRGEAVAASQSDRPIPAAETD